MKHSSSAVRILILPALLTSLSASALRAGVSEEAAILRHVKTLAGTIGARTPGSSQDRAAIEYIAREFARVGLRVERQPVTSVPVSPEVDTVLSSENVIGTRPGPPGPVILIGAHHDSRNSRCPGAADDASGIAVLIEAARVLAARPRRAPLVFVSFAGEETFGLPGSREFVRRWKGPPFGLAVTMDFVSRGRIFIAPFPRPPERWAVRRLAEATRGRLRDRVSFDPWLALVPRLMAIPFAADHEPFLAAGVPALNLSCEFPAWTYHTPEDRPERVDPATLLAARDTIVRLVEGAEKSPVHRGGEDRRYLPLPLGRWVLILPGVLVTWIPVLLAGLGLGLLARRGRALLRRAPWWGSIRWVFLALPLTAVAVSGGFLIHFGLSLLKGVNQPAYAHPRFHLVLFVAASLGTVRVALLAARRFSRFPGGGPALGAAVLVQATLAIGTRLLGGPDLAFPFLIGLGGLLVAAAVSTPVLRVGAAGAGVLALLPFLSPTSYRMFLELAGVPVPPWALPVLATLLAWPWFLALLGAFPPVAARVGPGRTRWMGAALGVVVLLLAAGAAFLPAYDEEHRVVVNMSQVVDPARKTAEVELRSVETLREVRLRGAAGERLPDRREFRRQFSCAAGKMVDIELLPPGAESGAPVLRIVGRDSRIPRLVVIRLKAAGGLSVLREEQWERRDAYRQVRVPAVADYRVELPVRWDRGGPLSVEVDVVLDEDFLGLQPSAPHRVIRPVSRIRHFREIGGGDSAAERVSAIIPPGIPR